jgi:hypothetical protein
VAESTKDALELNKLIHEETRPTGTEHGKHSFLLSLKKVVQGTRTFVEVIKHHDMYVNIYT